MHMYVRNERRSITYRLLANTLYIYTLLTHCVPIYMYTPHTNIHMIFFVDSSYQCSKMTWKNPKENIHFYSKYLVITYHWRALPIDMVRMTTNMKQKLYRAESYWMGLTLKSWICSDVLYHMEITVDSVDSLMKNNTTKNRYRLLMNTVRARTQQIMFLFRFFSTFSTTSRNFTLNATKITRNSQRQSDRSQLCLVFCAYITIFIWSFSYSSDVLLSIQLLEVFGWMSE